MKKPELDQSLKDEAAFFDDLINSKLRDGTIPIQADYRRATKFLPENDGEREIIDPKLYKIVEGELHDEMISRISFQGGKVLDICCGPGALSLELARNGLDVKGYDISESAINTARLMAKENPFTDGFGKLEYFCQDVNTIDFTSEKYSTIVGNSAFHHIYDLEMFLEKCYHSLEPGGLMVTFDDIGFSKMDYFLKNLFLFILPKYGLSYKQKMMRLWQYIFAGKKVSNEIFSPMEVWASKHDTASNEILDFWTKKLKTEKIIYWGAFSVQVCNATKGPDWFRYSVARFITGLDRFLIKIGVCRGFYRIIYSTKK